MFGVTKMSEDYKLIGDDPADAVPAEPKRRNRNKQKDNGNHGQTQAKSDAKIIELAKIANAPAPNILGGKPGESGPDPFDLASAVVDQDYLKAAATEQMARPLKIRKPGKEFFMALPFYLPFNLYADTADGKIDKDFYFVMPSMALAMEGETFQADLVLCVNSHDVAFFWPVRLLDEDRTNAWTESARDAVKQATTNWVRIKSNQKPGAGYYDIILAKGDLGEPKFPVTDQEGYLRLLNAATPSARKIAAPDHPIFFHKIEGRR
jgi:hypothetical protein